MDRLLNATDLPPVAKGQAYPLLAGSLGDGTKEAVKFRLWRGGQKYGAAVDVDKLRYRSTPAENAQSIADDAGTVVQWFAWATGETRDTVAEEWQFAVPRSRQPGPGEFGQMFGPAPVGFLVEDVERNQMWVLRYATAQDGVRERHLYRHEHPDPYAVCKALADEKNTIVVYTPAFITANRQWARTDVAGRPLWTSVVPMPADAKSIQLEVEHCPNGCTASNARRRESVAA